MEQLVAKRKLFVKHCEDVYIWYRNKYKKRMQPEAEPGEIINEVGEKMKDHSQ